MLCTGESIWKFHYMELIRGIWNEVKPGLLLRTFTHFTRTFTDLLILLLLL